MYVACPSCKSLYAVSAEQLGLAGGQVRCGQCQTRFNAVRSVFDDPQQALASEPPLQPALAQEIDDLVGRALNEVPTETPPPNAEPVTPAPAPPVTALSTPAAKSPGSPVRADVDCYAQPTSAEFTPWQDTETDDDWPQATHGMVFDDEQDYHAHTSWGAVAASLLLTVLLLGQYAYWDRYRLSQISALRPALEWLCAPLKCDLPLRHNLAKVEMIEREVRDHPRVKDALLVSASFINRAPYTQAYPVLQISFSDVAGAPVAARRFAPEEYLRKKNAAIGMAPGEETLVVLEVVDPGTRAVSFQFEFM